MESDGVLEGNALWDTDPLGLAGGRGERGATGGAGGQNSDNPYKHCRQHPTDPNKIECKHHQTGKWISKPKPSDWPEDKSKAKSEMCGDDCQAVAGTVVVGGALYILYRCGRMVPSLLPPLWWTIPLNAAVP